MKLLIIGRYAWESDDIKATYEQHPFRNDVLMYDYMDVEELSKVIGAAYALTFVSVFEGFGIPILEAMQCGVPGIVSNTSSMPEVAGNAALLVDPTSVNDIADAMRTLYKDEGLRNQLRENALVQAKRFSWDESAKAFYIVLEKMCSSNP